MRLTHLAQPHAIGIDIGHDSVKLLQLRGAAEMRPAVAAAARRSFPPELRIDSSARLAALPGLLRDLLTLGDFQGRRAVVSLPSDLVEMRTVRLPASSGPVSRQLVSDKAGPLLPFTADEAAIDFLVAGEVNANGETWQEVIVFAIRQSSVDHLLERLNEAELTVSALDAEPCAAYRSLWRTAGAAPIAALLDVGAQRSRVIIGEGPEICFVKSIEIAGHQLNDAVSRKVGISLDDARQLRRQLARAGPGALTSDPVRKAICDATRGPLEELARAVGLCLRYHAVTFRGRPLSAVTLTGGEAEDPFLRTALESALPVPVEVRSLLAGIDRSGMRSADRQGAMGEWTVALGLALHDFPIGPVAEVPSDARSTRLAEMAHA